MPPTPWKTSSFTLDSSGVAGLFGGDETVMAMATVHIYEGRKWIGWYNSSGSYTVAKRYGQLADSKFWDGLYPGVKVDPAALFGLDGKVGPKYIASHSGTILEKTGHMGHLLLSYCESLTSKPLPKAADDLQRKSSPVGVTIVELETIPSLLEGEIGVRSQRNFSVLLAAIPISFSVGTCALSGVYSEWYAFSMILLGILANGISCYVIGMGRLKFEHPLAAAGSPPGHGILQGRTELVVLKGEEVAVNSVTRGFFTLHFGSQPKYNNIGLCSLLLTAQFLLQLLLIPQSSLFGQVMFLTSLAISWLYNSYLASFDRDELQTKLLLKEVLGRPKITKYKFGTFTTAVAFTALTLRPPHPKQLLDHLIPNKTETWDKWKAEVEELIRADGNISSNEKAPANFGDDEKLLGKLRGDVQVAKITSDYYNTGPANLGNFDSV